MHFILNMQSLSNFAKKKMTTFTPRSIQTSLCCTRVHDQMRKELHLTGSANPTLAQTERIYQRQKKLGRIDSMRGRHVKDLDLTGSANPTLAQT
jgi:hypothetical protein